MIVHSEATYSCHLNNLLHPRYECLLGAIEMGYNVDGFLLVNEDTLVNSWNYGKNDLDPRKIWHGNEHAKVVTADNINDFEKKPQDIMRSMLGILHAFQFLEDVLLSRKPFSTDPELVPPPPPPGSSHGHARSRRSEDQGSKHQEDLFQDDLDQTDEDYSMEEMKLMHDDTGLPMLDESMMEHHESSIVDDVDNNSTRPQEFHINLFGEIVHDAPELVSRPEDAMMEHDETLEETLEMTKSAQSNHSHEVSELLFHPANFITEASNGTTDDDPEEDLNMEQEHFSDMMFNIKSVYSRIHDQLNLWVRFKKMRMRPASEVDEDEMYEMKKQLEHLNCHNAANAEICFLVASYFSVLDENEGETFRLVYDDLPIYYVPEAFKDRLYLLANLFTK